MLMFCVASPIGLETKTKTTSSPRRAGHVAGAARRASGRGQARCDDSSFGAIGYGHKPTGKPFTEEKLD
ncbi:MAG: hypothetical protein U0Y68_11065 [Blastocatellia bacterium]